MLRIALVAACIGLPAASFSQPTRPPEVLSGREAQDLLKFHVGRDRSYKTPRCIAYVYEGGAKGTVEPEHTLAVRELHGDGCPGGPATTAVLDRYAVGLHTGALYWVSIERAPYSAKRAFDGVRAKR